MTIEFNCHVCGKLLRTSDDKAGRTAKCPGCGEGLLVPQSETDVDDYEDDDVGDSEMDDYDDVPVPPPRSGPTKPCPMCGEKISAAAARCRFCGEEIDGGYSRSNDHLQPHRGAMILTFGILSLFICQIFGIVAWVLANNDLQEIEAGRMDPEGEGLTKAGKIIGIVSLSLTAAMILLYCVGVMIFVAAGAAAQ
jgi:DNA-directed RNA polymerase subunit RPC12/RpoP